MCLGIKLTRCDLQQFILSTWLAWEVRMKLEKHTSEYVCQGTSKSIKQMQTTSPESEPHHSLGWELGGNKSEERKGTS